MNSEPDSQGRSAPDDPGGLRGLVSRPETSTITDGAISRTIWRLAVPTWAAFVCLNFMGVLDMFFVGKLGATAVASVAMGGIMIGIVVMLALGVAMGTTALVANSMGSGDRERAERVTGQGLILAVFMSVLLACIGIPLAPKIIGAMGASPDVVREGSTYLRIVAAGGMPLLVQISLAGALRGAGDAVTPMKALVAAILLNAILDPIMIFGMFGCPALGVAGSAAATVLGRIGGVVVLFIALLSSTGSSLTVGLHHLWPRFDVIGRILRIGVFASGRVLLRNISRLALMRMAAMFGTPAVAAFGICFRLQMFILGPGKGLGTAAATMVGQNLGADKPGRGTRSGWIAAGYGVGIGIIFMIGFWVAPAFLIRVFNRDPEVVATGVSLLRWFAGSFPLLLLGFVLGEAMTGAGDSLRPMLVTGVAQVGIGLPAAGMLASYWNSASGIWAGFFVGNMVVGLLSAVVFYRERWQNAKTEAG